jgi:hypothetical protein
VEDVLFVPLRGHQDGKRIREALSDVDVAIALAVFKARTKALAPALKGSTRSSRTCLWGTAAKRARWLDHGGSHLVPKHVVTGRRLESGGMIQSRGAPMWNP